VTKCRVQRCGRAAAEAASQEARAQMAVSLPVGRPPAADISVYDGNGWRQRALEEISGSSVVIVASLVYDDPDLHSTLLRRLRGRDAFDCSVFVDRDTYEQRTYRYQRARILELQKHGGSIFLCTGRDYNTEFGARGQRGHFHMKALVIDNKISYVGSANATRNSRINGELVLRLVGSSVVEVVKSVLAYKSHQTTLSTAS